MPAGLPETLDAWRMLAARRTFDGAVPLTAMHRLRDALEQPEGSVSYELAFDRDGLDVPYLQITARAELPLVCQRTLQRFLLPVAVEQRLGLLASDDQEAALPEGYEALVPDADGTIRPLELIEDELILAIPVVPVDPASEPVALAWPPEPASSGTAEGHEGAARTNPFAVLADLKQTRQHD